MTEVLKLYSKNREKKVFEIIPDSAVMLDYGGPMVTINQRDPLSKSDYDYDSIHLGKHDIVRMTAHLVQEGVNLDLSYKELNDLIRGLTEYRDRFTK